MSSSVSRWLGRSSPAVFSAYAVVVAFSTYFCMYAFRKPFAAASFEGQKLLDTDIDLKTALVIGQIVHGVRLKGDYEPLTYREEDY